MSSSEDQFTNMWTMARRTDRMNPSVLRELLKVTDRPGIISFAGGLPSPQLFPLDAFEQACRHVLRVQGAAALQYSASEGYMPLRQAVAEMLPWRVDPAQVLITTGSQQALDLVGKILLDAGSPVLVESPTYLGALQAFAPMEPQAVEVASDNDGVDPADLARKRSGARFLYLQPNFQNPTGRTSGEARRRALVQSCRELALPIVEDDPYGELWFDHPPPASLASRHPEGTIYIGTFSKVLAPGLRLGFMVAPSVVAPKLLQAKQAADLHTPSFNQRLVAQVLEGNFLATHVPKIRALYKSQRDAMVEALAREMRGLDVSWNVPEGGMFLWGRLPDRIDATRLLPLAVERGVAFVPGAPFYANRPDPRALRLSYVTATRQQIDRGIAILADTVRAALISGHCSPAQSEKA